MRVDRPGIGTGEPCGSPHRRPNWVRVLTDEKIAALLAARPPILRAVKPVLSCWKARES